MAVSLLDTFQSYFTPDVLQQTSTFLGESPAHTESGVRASVPALLAGLTERMTTTIGSERVMSLIKQVGARLDVPALLGADATPPFHDLAVLGGGLLSGLFGGNLGPIVEALADISGLRTESALSLLSLLTPIVLGVLGGKLSSIREGATGLASRLASEREEYRSFVPTRLLALVEAAVVPPTAAIPAAAVPGAIAAAGTAGAGRVRQVRPAQRAWRE